jgi:hypothetical protein
LISSVEPLTSAFMLIEARPPVDTTVVTRRLVALSTSAVLLAGALAILGCGESTPVDRTVTVTSTVTKAAAPTAKRHAAPTRRGTAATTTATAPAATSEFAACDANISVRAATTTCPFAQNVFYAYWASGQAAAIRAYSPASLTTYALSCVTGSWVRCSGGDRAEIRFSQAAVEAYSDAQAAAYAARADLGPEGSDSASSGGSDSGDDGPYDEGLGSGQSDDDFCTDHACIPNYDEGTGSTVICADGTYSHSGGIQGACSHHGGLG